ARFLISAGPRHVLLDGDGARELAEALDGADALPPADLRGAFSPWRTERQRRADSLARKLARAQGENLSALLAVHDAELGGGGWTYLNMAQAQLDAPRVKALREGGALQAVAMAHDLTALDRPELTRPAEPGRALAFLAAAEMCDLAIYASDATRALAEAQMEAPPLGLTAPPGLTPLPRAAASEDGAGAFVMLGAVEPRRGHLAMLWIWDRLWRELGADAPRLLILGRRGAEAEMVADVLDRAPMAGRAVFERPDLPDEEVAARLVGARALLAPSLAEGVGLQVAEALAAGCPVIAADLPALRAMGGEAPDYLDPLDLPAWIEAILAYAHPHEGAPDPRAAQLERLARWQAPRWEAHFEAVEAALAR
ncbi:MAG: glycosyltransferase, partial [Pseudomonadota bacterium]